MSRAARPELATPLPWRLGPWRGLALPGFEDFDPLAWPWEAARLKQTLPAGVTLAKRSPSRWVLSVAWNGHALHVKRTLAPTLRARLSALVKGTKSAREFAVARAIIAHGLRTPEPVLFARGPRGESYLATRSLPADHEPVSIRLRRENRVVPELLEALADLTRLLHESGVWHADWRTDHVFSSEALDAAPLAERFALLDLDGAVVVDGTVSAGRRARSVHQLFVSLLRRPFTREHADQFVARYGLPLPPAAVLYDKAVRDYDQGRLRNKGIAPEPRD